MKKIGLLVCILGSILMSDVPKYQVGLSYGLISTNTDNVYLENHSLQTSVQANDWWKFPVKPRLDFEYTFIHDQIGLPDHVFRVALNGIYDVGNFSKFQPYLLAGIGYEFTDEEGPQLFQDSGFFQGGLGLRYELDNNFMWNVEVKGLSTFDEGDELHIFTGIVIPFGEQEISEEVEVVEAEEEIESLDFVAVEEPEENITENIVLDTDGDGVSDAFDRCPTTPEDYTDVVDQFGCVAKFVLKANFKADSFEVQDKYITNIKKFAKYLKTFPKYSAQITGHTSADKTTHVGLKLSEDRAKAIKKYLVKFGVSAERLFTVGVGGHHPIASNSTKAGRKQNRRIEVKVFR